MIMIKICATCEYCSAMVTKKRIIKKCKIHGEIPKGHEYVDRCVFWKAKI